MTVAGKIKNYRWTGRRNKNKNVIWLKVEWIFSFLNTLTSYIYICKCISLQVNVLQGNNLKSKNKYLCILLIHILVNVLVLLFLLCFIIHSVRPFMFNHYLLADKKLFMKQKQVHFIIFTKCWIHWKLMQKSDCLKLLIMADHTIN